MLCRRSKVCGINYRSLSAAELRCRSSRADNVIATLLACYSEKRELILWRSAAEAQEGALQSLKVGLLFDDELQVTRVDCKTGHVPNSPAVLIATSGTTGMPKLALHNFEKLSGRIPGVRMGHRDARWLLTYHPASFAGLQVILTAIGCATPLIAVQDGAINSISHAATQHFPTHVSGTPTFWRAFLLSLRSRAEEISLKQITIGGEAVDQPILDQLRTAFPVARNHSHLCFDRGGCFVFS